MNRRKLLLGGAAILAAIVEPAWSQALLNSGGKVSETAAGRVVTRPPTPTLPSAGLATPIYLTNPAGQPTQSNPFFSFGMPLGRSDFLDASQKLALYDRTGLVKITDCQVDMISRGWQPDRSVNQCSVSGYLSGNTLAAAQSGTFTLRADPGAAPTTPVCTLASLAAQSDLKAICVIGPDTYTFSVNTAIASMGGSPVTYPQTYVRQWKSGPYVCDWCFGGYLKRNSDGGGHRWAFLKLYVAALGASGPFIVRGYLENPLSYGPNPLGTIGAVGPNPVMVAVNSIDIFNGATRIGSIGGALDGNSATFTPTNVNMALCQFKATAADGSNATTNIARGRCAIGFSSTGTLPAGLVAGQTYWAVADGTNGGIIPFLDRLHASGFAKGTYGYLAAAPAGTAVALNRFIYASGGVYLCTTAGTSTGALPTGPSFADKSAGGSLVWTLISAQITSAGTGTHTMLMQAAIWGGSKVPLVGPDTYPFWSGPAGTSLAKFVVGYDRAYVMDHTKSVLPIDPLIVTTPWVGPLPRYVQNTTYLPGAPNDFYIGDVGEANMDERINMCSPTFLAAITQPTDVGMAMSCRMIALSWVDRNASYRDERAHEIQVANYGPDRLGGTYAGMPPNNPKFCAAVTGSGSPAMIGLGDWTGYGGGLFGNGQAPDAAHTPIAPYGAAIMSGDPMFFDELLELANLAYSNPGTGQKIRTALFNGKNLGWGWGFYTQAREAAHGFQIVCDAEWITPDNHPAKPYLVDIMDDSAAIIPLWAAANLGPKAQSIGYLPFVYPTLIGSGGQLQEEETWMLGYFQIALLGEAMKANRPGFLSALNTYLWKAILPLFDADVGGNIQFIDLQYDFVGSTGGGPVPPTEAQFLTTVNDRLGGNPSAYTYIQTPPTVTTQFINGSTSAANHAYRYRAPGVNNAAFTASDYGMTARCVCEMGTMLGMAQYKKIADRIQAFLDANYAGNPCNFALSGYIANGQAGGNNNGLMYAVKRH